MPFQYANEANPRAHYEGTGAEIAEALDRVDVLVAGLGTGGTLMGDGRAAARDASRTSSSRRPSRCRATPVMGLRSLEDGYVPPILDVSKLDRKLLVSNEESVAGLRGCSTRRASSAASRPARSCTSRASSPTSSRRASSSASSPTAAGSTSPPTSGSADDVERVDGADRLVVIPAAVRAELARRTREEEAPNEACGLVVLRDGVAERYVRGRNAAASPYRFELEVAARDVVPRGRGLRARRLPLAPLVAAAAVAHRRREHRPLAGQAVPDPLARLRRARRLDDRGRADRAARRRRVNVVELAPGSLAVDGAASRTGRRATTGSGTSAASTTRRPTPPS